MTNEEHAKIWRRAAAVVGSMDVLAAQQMQKLAQYQGQQSISWQQPYSSDELVMSSAYRVAYKVLSAIAKEYEDADKEPHLHTK